MKWIPGEIDTYFSAKEYIDTAIIPLYSISFGDEMRESAAKHEFISLLTAYMERQYTGRLILFPPFTYLKNSDPENVLVHLKEWETIIEENDFKHIFYITSESDWKLHEQKLKGSVLWLPAIPLDSMNDAQKLSIVESQVKQLSALFAQRWHENSQNLTN